ncbi:MAG: hypothetical protein Q4E73_04245 [Lachnospiraceae bacterium]|nr:hypothetical protein [Lachnospiraceae bacterium]
MGNYAVAKFMLQLLGVGAICLLITMILIIRKWRRKSVAGEKIFLTIFALFGIFLTAWPFMWIINEREKSFFTGNGNYIHTGTMLNWEDNGTTFVYDDQIYESVELTIYGSEDCKFEDDLPFDFSDYIQIYDDFQGKAVFNIQERDDLISKILKQTGRNTMFEVHGTFQGKMYYDESSAFYCLQDEKEDVIRYYSDFSHYNWYIRKRKADENIMEGDFDKIVLSEQEKQKILKLRKYGTKQKLDLNLQHIAGGIQDDVWYDLEMISQDNLIRGTMSLVKYEGNWYWDMDEEPDEDNPNIGYVMKLPKSVSEKMNQMID